MNKQSDKNMLDTATKEEVLAVLNIVKFVLQAFLKNSISIELYAELMNVVIMIETFVQGA